MKIENITCERVRTPLAVTNRRPRFSWEIESEEKDVLQSAYQIVVKDHTGAPVWDSGKVQSRETVDIMYAGEPLVSSGRYVYQITVWDNQGNEAVSEEERFETALLDSVDWKAQWIGFDECAEGEKAEGGNTRLAARYFRKDFTVSGGSEREVLITLDTDELKSKGISPAAVYQVLSYSNTNLPLAMTTYEGKSSSLRFDAEFNDLADMENLAVGADEEGNIIRLADVAEVEIKASEPETVIKNDGKNIVLVDVTKRADGDTMSISSWIRQILDQQEKEMNGAVHFNIIADDARTISASLEAVINSGIMGVIVAILVIFFILGNVQATLTIAISMPLSIFFTFIAMAASGISISLMSISGMVVALGAIVDGSIVMLEQVYKHWQTKKNGRFLYTVSESIFKSADEVGSSILGSTITTVIVFVPILFVSGLGGQIMYEVALTFMYALSASCIVAIVIIPYLLKKLLKEERKDMKDNAITRFADRLTGVYGNAVSWTLKNRKFVILMSVVILLVTVWAVVQLGIAFIPSTDNSEFYVNLYFPSSYTQDRTEAEIDRAEQIVRQIIPEVQTIVTTVGSTSGLSFSSSTYNGNIRVILPPVAQRDKDRDVHTLMTAVKTALDSIMIDCQVEVLNGGFDNLASYVTGGGGFGLTLVGEDMDTLYSDAERIKRYLESDPEVMSVTMDSSYDAYSTVIEASNELLSSLGITGYEAGTTTAILFNGMDCGIYTDPDSGERYDIRLESSVAGEPVTMDTLENLEIISQSGIKVNYAAVADLAVENTISQINHTDRANTISLSAAITGESSSSIQSLVTCTLQLFQVSLTCQL